ncbi:MAG: hypothetical protein NTW38_11265 [Candidatus Aminicenantes bacterium]|nr:hypothetical protein [Candidatus Aminicenantes bacterium]
MKSRLATTQFLILTPLPGSEFYNRMWTKRNRTFLRVVKLLKPRAGARISVDDREDVSLEL